MSLADVLMSSLWLYGKAELQPRSLDLEGSRRIQKDPELPGHLTGGEAWGG